MIYIIHSPINPVTTATTLGSILLSNLGANVISVSRSIESGRCMADQFRKDGVHDKCWIAAADCLDTESYRYWSIKL